jgi:hypothetical protein
LRTSSCIKASGICAWRISSSAPSVDIVRHALSRPKRAPRKLPITAANSASGSVAAWSFNAASHAGGNLRMSSGRPTTSWTARSDASFLACVSTYSANDVRYGSSQLFHSSCASHGAPLVTSGKISFSLT